ncbi:MAG: response regulator transcription factor, partial [Oscillospiraceae bacterium]|nr:response regulator transcription factor [Oscillospiraceae bacterium]
MNRIYIVEDDDSIRQLVLYALKNSGYEAQGFPCGADFFAAAREQAPDLLLLDIMLPDMDGVQILRQVRASSFSHIPVMMLTAKGSEFDKVNALDTGADDYMTKPFGVMELISRIKALLRRVSTAAPATPVEDILSCGPITLDRQKHQVTN